MNKQVFLLLFLICAANAAVTFTVDTDRSGFSSVVVSLEGEAGAEVLLPPDASSFRIVGGSYSMENGTAVITSGKTGFTTFSFTTDMLTEKEGSGWHLSFTPPAGAETFVFMPPYATIITSSPQPMKVTAEDSRTVLEMGQEPVSISYSLEAPPPAEPEGDAFYFFLFGGMFMIVFGLVTVLFKRWAVSQGYFARKTVKRPTLDITPGKKEMMDTFNENDLTIVRFLMGSGGKARRNELERKTEVSKSSLAMALNRLERRKIVEMDRTSTTHFVKLSDYFLRL